MGELSARRKSVQGNSHENTSEPHDNPFGGQRRVSLGNHHHAGEKKRSSSMKGNSSQKESSKNGEGRRNSVKGDSSVPELPKQPKGPETIRTALVIKNLPLDLTEENLIKELKTISVEPVALNFHYEKGKIFRGFAFANFKSKEETQAAMKVLEETEIGGKKLRVEYKLRLPGQERKDKDKEKDNGQEKKNRRRSSVKPNGMADLLSKVKVFREQSDDEELQFLDVGKSLKKELMQLAPLEDLIFSYDSETKLATLKKSPKGNAANKPKTLWKRSENSDSGKQTMILRAPLGPDGSIGFKHMKSSSSKQRMSPSSITLDPNAEAFLPSPTMETPDKETKQFTLNKEAREFVPSSLFS